MPRHEGVVHPCEGWSIICVSISCCCDLKLLFWTLY